MLHVDLHEVAPDEPVVVSVPVETTGESKGVKTGGGILSHVLYKVKVRALPKDLPEQILVDITELDVNQVIHLGDLPAPAGVKTSAKSLTVLAVTCRGPKGSSHRGSAGGCGRRGMLKKRKRRRGGGPSGQSGERRTKKDEKKAEKK